MTAVFALVGKHLVQAGKASWTGGWTGAGRLVARDTTLTEIFDLVHAAMDKPTEVSRLRLHLATLGPNTDKPVSAASPPNWRHPAAIGTS